MAKLRMAKASERDRAAVIGFLSFLENHVEYNDLDPRDLGQWLIKQWRGDFGAGFARFVWGFETLLDNACDPDLDYLEYKPEILEMRGLLTRAVNQRIDDNWLEEARRVLKAVADE